MPITESAAASPATPATPAPPAKVARDKMKADVKRRETKTEEFKSSLSDAQSAVAEAWADVKRLTEAGEPCNLVELTAAIDDQTKAIADITAGGSRFGWLPDEEAKALRNAHATLQQAYSDLRTLLEFGTGSADLSALPVILANMDAAVKGVGSAIGS